ncbi:hypothetical protein FOB55_01860 [Klebsiella michiganensis]|nr:hypothetical protein FOB55_01860 [Klebsiella michiganensis]
MNHRARRYSSFNGMHAVDLILPPRSYPGRVEQGGLTLEQGQRFREAILSRGTGFDLTALYRQWRERAVKSELMLENRGARAWLKCIRIRFDLSDKLFCKRQAFDYFLIDYGNSVLDN